MVTILIEVRRLLQGRRLLETSTISMLAPKKVVLIRGQLLFEARRLLEEIRYFSFIYFIVGGKSSGLQNS